MTTKIAHQRSRVDRVALASLAITVIGTLIALFAIGPAQLNANLGQYGALLTPHLLWILLTITLGLVAVVILLTRRLARIQTDLTALAAVSAGAVAVVANRTSDIRTREFSAQLNQATSITAIGIANNVLTSELTPAFYKDFLLGRQGQLQIMFLDPDGAEIKEREKVEARAEGALSFFVKHNLEDFKSFISSCAAVNPRVVERVEVRLYDFPPSLNCVIFNNSVAFVHHYGTHARGPDAPTLIVTADAPDIFGFYVSEMEAVWKLGKTMTLT